MEEVICPISENAKNAPHHPAIIADQRSWSYAELDSSIQSLCHFLKETGIKKHERIAFIAKSHPHTIVLLFALFRLGAIACPLSFRIPNEQIAVQLLHLGASHILEPETLPLNISKQASLSSIHFNDIATLLLTSGSSGTPKAASLTFANHYYSALGAILPLQLETTSRWLLSLPLFHVSGLGILFRCFQKGAAVVLSNLNVSDVISRYQITHLSQVPTQLYRMLQEPDLKFTESLKCIILGGAPLSLDLMQRAECNHLPVLPTYGMTEMSSMITLSGKVLPFREMKIAKDGEIWVRGKTLFKGYWDPTSQTLIKNADNEWFPTKDLGQLTTSGDLEIIGRKDRQFVSGGENIQPEEIEKALCAIPGIRQASVVPTHDAEFGKRPVAFIDDTTAFHTLHTIREALQSMLPSFKHPIAIYAYPPGTDLKPNLAQLQKKLKS